MQGFSPSRIAEKAIPDIINDLTDRLKHFPSKDKEANNRLALALWVASQLYNDSLEEQGGSDA